MYTCIFNSFQIICERYSPWHVFAKQIVQRKYFHRYVSARKIRGFREEFLGEEIFRIPDKFYGTPLRSLRAAMKDQASRCWLGRRIFITLDTHSIAYIPASISRNMEPGWSSCVHTQMKRIRYVETSNETWTRCTTLF